MERECSVVNCDNRSSEAKVFYKFPLSFDMCMQWVQITGNQKLVQEFAFGGAQPFLDKYICSDHFLDKDFAIFADPHSGLRCDAIPISKRLPRKSKIKDTPVSSIREDATASNSSDCNDALTHDIKIEEDEADIPQYSDITENTSLSGSIHDADSNMVDVPVVTYIKEEPEPEDIESTGSLPITLIDPEDENISDSYEAISIVANSAEEPEILESTLPLPSTVFAESDVPLINIPKTETGDIEEVLIPEDAFENDVNMRMRMPPYQFGGLPGDELYEEYQGTNFMFEDEDYINTNEGGPVDEQLEDKRRRDALRQALARERETPEQRAIRLEKTRIRAAERRAAESEVETTIRRYKSAVRVAIKRTHETEEERLARQEKNKIRAAERRRNMTPEERKAWRERNRVQTRDRRENESDIKKLVRRYNNAIRAQLKRSRESPEQRADRRVKDALRAAQRRKSETPEEREKRLQKDRERITLRRLELLMTETPEQREARLKKERERMWRKRHGLKEDSTSQEENDTINQTLQSPTQESEAQLLNFNPIFPTILNMLPKNLENVFPSHVSTKPQTVVESNIETHPQSDVGLYMEKNSQHDVELNNIEIKHENNVD